MRRSSKLAVAKARRIRVQLDYVIETTAPGNGCSLSLAGHDPILDLIQFGLSATKSLKGTTSILPRARLTLTVPRKRTR